MPIKRCGETRHQVTLRSVLGQWFAKGLWVVGYMLFALLPSAQVLACDLSGSSVTMTASLGNTPCFEVKIPQGRKFVVVTLLESVEHWQTGNGCFSDKLGDCNTPLDVSVSVSTIGFSTALAGTARRQPPGTGWINQVFPRGMFRDRV